MSSIDDIPSELSGNNRLYGAPNSILGNQKLKQWNSTVISADILDLGHECTPAHRYGAIALTPSYDRELYSLFQMIFEYLETNKSDSHRNLQFCWNCNSSVPVERQVKYPNKLPISRYGEAIKVGTTGYPKYYVTCPRCKAFRVDNHCVNCGKAIIKHTKGNYHKWDDSVENSKWAFLCPDCGSPVNRFAELSSRILTKEDSEDLPF